MQLDKLFLHFQNLYGRNNSVYITSLAERINLLIITVRRLQDAIRKKRNRETLEKALANVISRTFAVAGHFWKLPLTQGMCTKYPMGGCGYCFTSPCKCLQHTRRAHKAFEPSETQLRWNLKQHQENLRELYGETNSKNGIENALNRLFAEIAEISELQSNITMVGSTANEIELEYAREIADVFAWTIAVAIILDIDIEETVIAMYGTGCPSCLGNPCTCPKFIVIDGVIHHHIESHPESRPSVT